MAYLNCGRCGLEIKIQAEFLQIEHCPRCLARSATAVPLTLSARRIRAAAGWGTPAPDPDSTRRDPGEPGGVAGRQRR